MYIVPLNDYLLSILSEKQYKKIIKALTIYYGNSFDIKKIKCLIISSSDSIGQTAFDVSNYQNRKHTLRKITKISSSRENKIVKFLVNHLNETYDYTGLIFYPMKWINKIIYKFFNSKYYFCSEISDMACRQAHIKISKNPNPTPWDIEKFNAYSIIFKNI